MSSFFGVWTKDLSEPAIVYVSNEPSPSRGGSLQLHQPNQRAWALPGVFVGLRKHTSQCLHL